jgi:hypothetical protein
VLIIKNLVFTIVVPGTDPMYIAVLCVIFGEAVVFASGRLFVYGLLVLAAFREASHSRWYCCCVVQAFGCGNVWSCASRTNRLDGSHRLGAEGAKSLARRGLSRALDRRTEPGRTALKHG